MRVQTVRESGSVLLIVLVTTVLIGLTLRPYLDMVGNANRSTAYSLAYNTSIPVLEAGIEEALTHLFHNPTNFAGNGWQLGDGYYWKERTIGNDDAKYWVAISTTAKPVILARAYVRRPWSTNWLNPPRTVRVTVTNAPMFAKGMVAKGQIDLVGNRILSNSFDSSSDEYSTDGRYDETKTRDKGDVATNSSLMDSLNVWNAEIYGKAATGPGGLIKLGSNGSVGSAEWHAAGKTGVQPGYSSDDMNVQFRDVKAPFTGGAFTPSRAMVDGTNYAYVITAGNWQMEDLELTGQEKVLVTGNAVLYVTDELSMSGNAQIIIATNASLQLYMAGAEANFGGNGVANMGGNATNFYYYGLPSNTSISLSGNAEFTGAVYAPQAHLSMGGGGSDNYDFMGASISASVKLNGNYEFHYDENLGKVGPRRGWMVESWNEIAQKEDSSRSGYGNFEFDWEEL